MVGAFCYLATRKYEIAVSDTITQVIDVKPWIVGEVGTPAGVVPRVATHLNAAARMGAIRIRIGLRRIRYAVEPANRWMARGGRMCLSVPHMVAALPVSRYVLRVA